MEHVTVYYDNFKYMNSNASTLNIIQVAHDN